MQRTFVNTARKDVYETITRTVIEALEKGVVMWQKPWSTTGLFPMNLTTQKEYRGWNLFYLGWVMKVNNYTSPYFLTFKQAQALGGSIKKGAHGYHITKWVVTEREKTGKNKRTGEEKTGTTRGLFPKDYTVFNVAQTENIAYPTVERPKLNDGQKIAACEALIAGMPNPPMMQEGGGRAYYVPSLDFINMPPFDCFLSAEHYYATKLHELVHSTGHQDRLNRAELVQSDRFGGEKYSKEELTAEMGAAFLCAFAGIENKTIDNSAAYLQSWLNALKNDKKLILQASAKAQAAVDYILNKQAEERDVETETGAATLSTASHAAA